jgi:hypothetical protein
MIRRIRGIRGIRVVSVAHPSGRSREIRTAEPA